MPASNEGVELFGDSIPVLNWLIDGFKDPSVQSLTWQEAPGHPDSKGSIPPTATVSRAAFMLLCELAKRCLDRGLSIVEIGRDAVGGLTVYVGGSEVHLTNDGKAILWESK